MLPAGLPVGSSFQPRGPLALPCPPRPLFGHTLRSSRGQGGVCPLAVLLGSLMSPPKPFERPCLRTGLLPSCVPLLVSNKLSRDIELVYFLGLIFIHLTVGKANSVDNAVILF